MTKIKLPVQHQILIFALILVFGGLTNTPIKASAESVKLSQNYSNSKGFFFKRIKAPKKGLPRGTRQAASRIEKACPESKIPLTALVPIAETESTTQEQVVWGLTTAEYPTLWFYVPFELTAERFGELQIQVKNQDGDLVTKNLLKITTSQPGIISIPWPQQEGALQIGESYIYQFDVNCKPNQTSQNVFVKASIERRTPSELLTSQLNKATEQQKATLYAQEGFWDESLTILAQLRRANPNDPTVSADWDALLQAGGLSQIKQQPIVSEIKLEEIKQKSIKR
jgi:hypothetical protein